MRKSSKRASRPLYQIAVPTDFYPASISAMQFAENLAKVPRTQVTAVYAIDPLEYSFGPKDLRELKKQQVAVATPPKAPPPVSQKPAQPTVAVTPAPPPARCDGVEAQVGNERRCLKPGAGKTNWFKDCPTCPEMVVAPAGRFTMGSPASEAERAYGEDQLAVTIGKPFAVGRFAVTRSEFAAFVAATGHMTDGGCFATVTVCAQARQSVRW
jgi:formylglycine-generating enzyme required for sulfatase activity